MVSGAGVGVAIGVGVETGVGVATGVEVGDGLGCGEGVAVALGLGVGDDAPRLIWPHQVPHISPVRAYSWMVHIEVSSTGSTTVAVKSPHRLSPVPKSLKYGA